MDYANSHMTPTTPTRIITKNTRLSAAKQATLYAISFFFSSTSLSYLSARRHEIRYGMSLKQRPCILTSSPMLGSVYPPIKNKQQPTDGCLATLHMGWSSATWNCEWQVPRPWLVLVECWGSCEVGLHRIWEIRKNPVSKNRSASCQPLSLWVTRNSSVS